MMSHIILASSSPIRRKLLSECGISFEICKPTIDERSVETAAGGDSLPPDDLALILAIAKAQDVSEKNQGAVVIGCDQVLSVPNENAPAMLHKVEDMARARRQLLTLRGRTHTLHTAVVIVSDAAVQFEYVDRAHMTMHELAPEEIGRYLSLAGDDVMGSVGCYQLEGPGARLFKKIDGDYFTILGLPLIPLLNALRNLGHADL
ncbi:MAG: Maf family nucleotide pyrophosphatase [Pseudomonadota bacterium]